jgi:hypothetical protein
MTSRSLVPATSRKRGSPSHFFWVNRDVGSGPPTREKGRAESAINRHAQLNRGSRRSKRKGGKLDSISTAKRIADESWSSAPKPSVRENADADEVEKVIRGTTIPPTNSVETLIDYGVDVSAADPFNSCAAKLDYGTMRSLHYHLTYSLTSSFRNEALATGGLDEQHRYFPVVEDVVQECMFNEMHMSALLSAVNMRMLLNTPEDKQLERRANLSMQLGISHLRKYFLSHPKHTAVDILVILDVFHLACGEWYRQCLPAAATHLRILKHFLHSLDLSRPFDRYVFDLIHFHDVFIALEGGTEPIFPLTWEPADPPTSQLSLIKTELDNIISKPRKRALWRRSTALTQEDTFLLAGPYALIQQHPGRLFAEVLGRDISGVEQRPGRSFVEMLSQNVFSPKFADIIAAFLVRIEVATHAHLGGNPSAEHVEWMNKKLIATLHKLAATLPETETDDGIKRPDQSIKLKIQECFRLGMITYLSYIASPIPWRIGEASLLRLQQAVSALSSDTFQTVQHVGGMEILDRMLLWSLLNGIFAAGVQEDQVEWFTVKAVVVARRLGLSGYIQLHRLMGEFCHSDTLHHAALKRLDERMESEAAFET